MTAKSFTTLVVRLLGIGILGRAAFTFPPLFFWHRSLMAGNRGGYSSWAVSEGAFRRSLTAFGVTFLLGLLLLAASRPVARLFTRACWGTAPK